MAPELQVKWFRSHAWLVALIGLVLEAAATIPFALLDVSAPEASAALAMLIGAAVAFVVGPRWGALVSAAGWGLFFAFVADQEARAILALPVWLAVAILAGLASDRLRRVERERQRDAGELDAVRHEAESRYHALAEALPLVTLISAPNDRNSVSYVSPQVETLLGYSPAEWQEDPELYSKLLHPDDRDEVLAGAKQQSTGAAPRKAEYRLLARGGGVVWVREEVTTIRGPEGKPLYTQTLLIDIGERKRAEEERERLLAAEREATARTVERQRRLDFVREAGQVLSSSLDYRSAIQRVAELAVREYADWCVVDIIEDGEPAQAGCDRAGRALEPGSRRRSRSRARRSGARGRRDGSSPDRSGSRRGLEWTEEDLDSRRNRCTVGHLRPAPGTEEDTRSADARTNGAPARPTVRTISPSQRISPVVIALAIDRGRLYREVEERADAARVVAHVADGVLLVDRGGVVRLWNPAAEAITSIAPADVLGNSAVEVIPGWKDAVGTIPISTSPDPGHAEVVIPFETDGGERWISISGVNFYGGTVYAFRDLTEVHQLEALKADFIATASHELRTPLAAVYGAAQTLLRHDFALDEGGRDRFVSLIADESERLGRIVNEILLANQLDAGRLDLGTEPFDSVEVVERVVEATRAFAPAEISLKISAGDELPLVAADRDKVRQVLVNLVENAIKYSPDGGKIEVGVEAHDGAVRFCVRDEGLGIPEGEEKRIFEKFYRLDPQMSRGVGGTGLGLYICNELVTRMGGRIWVEANGKKGSTFLFELPAAPALTPQSRADAVELHGFVPPGRRAPHK